MMKTSFALLILASLCLRSCSSGASANADMPPPSVDTGIVAGNWAFVPAGEFFLGQHNHETMVDYDYEVMITDVTNAQYAQYLNEALAAGSVDVTGDQVVGFYEGDEFHGHEHEEEISAGDYVHLPLTDDGLRLDYDGQMFTVKAGYDDHPMVLVSWFGARAYCEYYGWRLPDEVEWEKAARGVDGRPFPWGDKITPENANYYSSHDIFEKIWGGAGGTTPVGFYNGKTYDDNKTMDSPSPYGLYDMAGNVWQWTGDIYENQHYRYMRGGSKENYEYNLRVWTRNSAGPTYFSPSVGFRCARDS